MTFLLYIALTLTIFVICYLYIRLIEALCYLLFKESERFGALFILVGLICGVTAIFTNLLPNLAFFLLAIIYGVSQIKNEEKYENSK